MKGTWRTHRTWQGWQLWTWGNVVYTTLAVTLGCVLGQGLAAGLTLLGVAPQFAVQFHESLAWIWLWAFVLGFFV